MAVRLVLFVALCTTALGCASISSQVPGGGQITPGVVIATIPVGEGPTLLGVAPDGSRVYAAANSKLSVIESATNRVVATVTTEPYPAGLALTPDGRRAFISNLFATRLMVVDLTVNAVAQPIALFVERFIGGFGFITMSPDGKIAYVANTANEAMAIIDVVKADTDILTMDMRPVEVAVAPDGRTAYVAGCKNFCTTGTIEVLDTTSRLVNASITVGSRPYRIKLSPDGRRAYTTNLADPSVSVVDLPSNKTTASVPVPVEPTGLALSPDGTLTFVASQPTGTITVIRNATNAVAATAKVASDARDVVVTPDGRHLYVSTLSSVVVVDTQALLGG